MDSLKALREKRNDAIAGAKAITEKAVTETRSLTDEEEGQLVEFRNIAEATNKTIKQIKEVRDLEGAVESIEVVDNPVEKVDEKVDKNETETRAMDAYVRGRFSEYRDITGDLTDGNAVEDTDGNGGVTVPTTVYDQIIAKLDEQAPVFQSVRKFPAQSGTLKIPREKDIAMAGFVGEGVDVKDITSKFGTVKLNEKRVGAAMQLTTELLHDSAVNLLSYSTQRLTRSVAKAVEYAVLVGAQGGQSADETFRPIIGAKDVATATFDGTVESLIDIHNTIPNYVNGAMWVVSRNVFNTIAKLRDGDGRILLLNNMIGDQPGYTLLGSPIFVTDALKGAKQEIVYGNFGEGYGMMVKDSMAMQHVTSDTTQALAGGHLIVLSAMMDGEVINPDAFVTAGFTPKA